MPVVIAMMAVTLLTGLATTVVLGTMTETAIAASHGEATAAFYATEAAVEFAVSDLATADWDAVLSGDLPSAFVDGPPAGMRTVGRATIDLATATDDTNALAGALAAASPYQLYAHGSFVDLVSGPAGASPFYVAVWVANLTAEETGEAEARVLGIIGRAYGPSGSRRSIAVSVTRDETAPTSIRVLSWTLLP